MKTTESDPTPAERVHDTQRMLDAMTAGIREAIEQHRRAGNPVAVWRDGRVRWIEARDIPAELAPEGPSSARSLRGGG